MINQSLLKIIIKFKNIDKSLTFFLYVVGSNSLSVNAPSASAWHINIQAPPRAVTMAEQQLKQNWRQTLIRMTKTEEEDGEIANAKRLHNVSNMEGFDFFKIDLQNMLLVDETKTGNTTNLFVVDLHQYQ